MKTGHAAMTANAEGSGLDLSVPLDAATFEALRRTAAERELEPAALVARWVRERLAHEAERAKGRARPQRPGE
jgi:hypothetical protein